MGGVGSGGRRNVNKEVQSAFREYRSDDPNDKLLKVQCQYCNWTKAKNPSRQLDHLKTCVPYLTAMVESGKQTTIAQKSQQRLLIMGKSSSQRDKANFLLALDPTFRPPSHDTIGTKLLDDCYEVVKQSVDAEVDKIEYLNITADESTDMKKRRIANLSALDRNRSFYYCNRAVGDKRMTAAATANWIREQVWRI